MSRAVRLLSQLILILSSFVTAYTLLMIGSWDHSWISSIMSLIGMTVAAAAITQVWYFFKAITTKDTL